MDFGDTFIKLVKSYNILYDINNTNYGNAYKTEIVWRRIAKQLNVKDYQLCIRKWHILCTYFKAAIRSNTVDWKYYQKLKFLEPFINYCPDVLPKEPDYVSRKVITVVKQYPCLYNPHLPENQDIKVRNEAWEKVSEKLQMDVPECKRRWRRLKEGYLRRRKTMLKTPNNYVHPWRFYIDLEFLNCVDIDMPINEGSCIEEHDNLPSLDELEQVDMNTLDQLSEEHLNWKGAIVEEIEISCLRKDAHGNTILLLHNNDSNDVSDDELSLDGSIKNKDNVHRKFSEFMEHTKKLCNELSDVQENDGLSALFSSLAMSVNQANLSHKQIIQLQQQTCAFVFEKLATYSAINISMHK